MVDQDGSKTNKKYGWTATEESLSSYFVVFLSILAFVIVCSSILHKSKLDSIIPEAGLTVIIGIFMGTLIYFLDDSSSINKSNDNEDAEHELAEGLLSFNSIVFFVYLLPPIIFNSGYHINREYFIRFFKPIVLFACLGTAISTIVVALVLYAAVYMNVTGGFQPSFPELLTFGALISATDPVSTLAVFQQKCVDPQLFYLVFGESVLNDAVGLVLFNTLAKFIGKENTLHSALDGAGIFLIDFCISFLGSLFLGLLSGIMAAYVLKVADMRQTRILELSSYILIMYAPFFAAEVLPFSGIVTSLFTGIAAKQYAEPNLSLQTAEDADVIFRVIAFLAETTLFLELGLSVFGLTFGNFYPLFVIFAIIGCLLGRLANIYPITFFFNRSLNSSISVSHEITLEDHRMDGNENRHGDGSNSGEGDGVGVYRNTHYSIETMHAQKIDMNTAHMLWFSGLRGAVAYACAKSFPNTNGNRSPFVVTTMAIVLLTVFLLGGTTVCALNALNIEMNIEEDKYLQIDESNAQNSFITMIEQRFILPCVIRDFNSTSISSKKSNLTDNANGSNDENDESFEMTNIRSFEMTASTSSNDKKESSLYDYGAN